MEDFLHQLHKADAKPQGVFGDVPSRGLRGENNHDNILRVGDYHGLVSGSLPGTADLATGDRRLCGTSTLMPNFQGHRRAGMGSNSGLKKLFAAVLSGEQNLTGKLLAFLTMPLVRNLRHSLFQVIALLSPCRVILLRIGSHLHLTLHRPHQAHQNPLGWIAV